MLAIITVIAVPKILNVIEKSKESSAEISAKMYIDSINKLNSLNAVDSNEYKSIDDGENIDISNISDKVKIKGTKPEFGKVTIVNRKVTKANLCVDDYMVNYDGTKTVVVSGCDVIISNITINSKENIKSVIYSGETVNLSVTTEPENIKVDYKSSNKEVATVSADGIVTGIGSGKTTITAYKKNIKDQIEINVIEPNIYVSADESDETGDGSKNKPYANLKEAIENVNSNDIIYIKAGTYELEEIIYDDYSSLGIYDKGKNLTIYGENEKTILKFDGKNGTKRDASVLALGKNSVLRNLVYIYIPNRDSNYSNSIFRGNDGKTQNVLFIIDNTSALASYDYYNDHSLTHTVENCTFYHTSGSVSSNYSSSGIYTNIATNVNTVGRLTNVVKESFTTETTDIQKIINASKNNKAFNDAKAGVFYGENAWK